MSYTYHLWELCIPTTFTSILQTVQVSVDVQKNWKYFECLQTDFRLRCRLGCIDRRSLRNRNVSLPPLRREHYLLWVVSNHTYNHVAGIKTIRRILSHKCHHHGRGWFLVHRDQFLTDSDTRGLDLRLRHHISPFSRATSDIPIKVTESEVARAESKYKHQCDFYLKKIQDR